MAHSPRSPHSPRSSRDRMTPPRLKSPLKSPIHNDSTNPKRLNATVLFPSDSKYVPFEQINKSTVKNVLPCPFSKSTIKRKIPSKPYQAMQIDNVATDFYFQPIDWSSKNLIGLVNNEGSTVIVSPDHFSYSQLKYVSCDSLCLKFAPDGDVLNLGSQLGPVRRHDIVKHEPISTTMLCNSALYSIEQIGSVVITGHENGLIITFDYRERCVKPIATARHEQVVCSLKQNSDQIRFASGSQDNKVKIWDLRNLEKPTLCYDQHESATRAISWSPKDKDMICSGGGFSDRKIRIWNSVTGDTESVIDAEAQICNIFWNKDYNEIATTEGYRSNAISVRSAQDLKLIGINHSNNSRINYAAMSPDQQQIVTVTDLDPMMFWKLFPDDNSKSIKRSVR